MSSHFPGFDDHSPNQLGSRMDERVPREYPPAVVPPMNNIQDVLPYPVDLRKEPYFYLAIIPNPGYEGQIAQCGAPEYCSRCKHQKQCDAAKAEAAQAQRTAAAYDWSNSYPAYEAPAMPADWLWQSQQQTPDPYVQPSPASYAPAAQAAWPTTGSLAEQPIYEQPIYEQPIPAPLEPQPIPQPEQAPMYNAYAPMYPEPQAYTEAQTMQEPLAQGWQMPEPIQSAAVAEMPLDISEPAPEDTWDFGLPRFEQPTMPQTYADGAYQAADAYEEAPPEESAQTPDPREEAKRLKQEQKLQRQEEKRRAKEQQEQAELQRRQEAELQRRQEAELQRQQAEEQLRRQQEEEEQRRLQQEQAFELFAEPNAYDQSGEDAEEEAAEQQAQAAIVPKPRSAARKVLSVLNNIMIFVVCFALIGGAIAFNVSSDPEKNFFGYRFYNVLTPSMTPTEQEDGTILEGGFKAGDMIIVKMANFEDVQIGDIITFNPDSGGGPGEQSTAVLTHRVVGFKDVVIDESTGEIEKWFVTKGDANNAEDPPIPPESLIGIKVAHVPKIGKVLRKIAEYKALAITFCVAVLILVFVLFYYFSKDEFSQTDTKKKKKKGAPQTA